MPDPKDQVPPRLEGNFNGGKAGNPTDLPQTTHHTLQALPCHALNEIRLANFRQELSPRQKLEDANGSTQFF